MQLSGVATIMIVTMARAEGQERRGQWLRNECRCPWPPAVLPGKQFCKAAEDAFLSVLLQPPQLPEESRLVHCPDLIQHDLAVLLVEAAMNSCRVAPTFRGQWRDDAESRRSPLSILLRTIAPTASQEASWVSGCRGRALPLPRRAEHGAVGFRRVVAPPGLTRFPAAL
jgi:hypothetical protein